MITVLTSSAVDQVKPKFEICICCFSTKHVALNRKRKDWLSWNQDNVSEWGDMSVPEMDGRPVAKCD